MPDDSIPVLEIGGTHVTAALVTADPWDLVPAHSGPHRWMPTALQRSS